MVPIPRGANLCLKCARRWQSLGLRWTSTGTTTSDAPPPLLSKIRNDLKSAMRAKDTARLNVLRAIITETSNASKGPSPVKTDVQVLALLRKRKAASKAAAQEALDVKREDLAQKQEAEITILDEYAGHVEVLPEDSIEKSVNAVISTLKSGGQKIIAGQVMKDLFKPGGLLDGKAVDKAQVAKMVQQSLTAA